MPKEITPEFGSNSLRKDKKEIVEKTSNPENEKLTMKFQEVPIGTIFSMPELLGYDKFLIYKKIKPNQAEVIGFTPTDQVSSRILMRNVYGTVGIKADQMVQIEESQSKQPTDTI